MIYWIASLAALLAVWLNIRRNVASFWIWSATNAIWTYADYTHGLHAQAALQAVYFALSIYGIRKWSTKKGNPHGTQITA
jgi:nicotinamide riboside transporter PnuC